jgi:hypothetical protein
MQSCAAGRLTRGRAPGPLGAALAAAAAPPHLPANRLTGLRLACNLFRHAPLRAWAASQRGALLRAFGGGGGAGAGETKAARGAWASLLVDLALLYRSEVRCSPPMVGGLLGRLAPRGRVKRIQRAQWLRCGTC